MKSQLSITRLAILSAAILAVFLGAGSVALAESWSSFSVASFSGMSISAPFETDLLTYTLTLETAPTITIPAGTFAIQWVQGFYALSTDPTKTLYAGGSNVKDGKKTTWRWDTNPNVKAPGNFINAGWTSLGSANRLYPGRSMSFTYSEFAIPEGTTVVPGFHIGYLDTTDPDCNRIVTAFFKAKTPVPPTVPPPSVPEVPAPLLAGLGAPLMGLAAIARRRLAR